MSRYYYAQIDENNKVIAVSDLSGPVDLENMISISEIDNLLIGKIWDGKNFLEDTSVTTIKTVGSQYFRNRFSNEELYRLYGSNDIQIKIWLDDIRLKLEIVVDESLDEILSKMVTLSILSEQRKFQILEQCTTNVG